MQSFLKKPVLAAAMYSEHASRNDKYHSKCISLKMLNVETQLLIFYVGVMQAAVSAKFPMREWMDRDSLLIDPDEVGYPRTILHGQVHYRFGTNHYGNFEIRMVLLELIGYSEVVVVMKMAAAEKDRVIKKRFK
ncbi:MAG: hypothetical protein A2Y97_09465 [Nitrospirae bacterium RBG_13_39_12]|nr:MAG: hypothetical protein A2Y97_09465 [Nitrospirae bacterium RBG_13_39_12]